MSVELTMLVYSAALLLPLIIIQTAAGIQAQGLKAMAGNRDDLPPPKPYEARTKRLVDNYREGLTLFAPLIIVAALAHISSFWTVLGAQLFFWGRLAHAGLYLGGVPWLRSFAWDVTMAGTVLVLLADLGLI